MRNRFFNQCSTKNSQHANVLISSYDVIRHDVGHFSRQQWNYCILDEGHLIKSSKTKLFKAIKQIRAANRLILTGTPIQNNVTELWCLFDFLIPGYLGKLFQKIWFYRPQINTSIKKLSILILDFIWAPSNSSISVP